MPFAKLQNPTINVGNYKSQVKNIGKIIFHIGCLGGQESTYFGEFLRKLSKSKFVA